MTLELMWSKDNAVKAAYRRQKTGRKWNPEEVINQAISRLKHRDIVGAVQRGRTGLGWRERTQRWERATQTERKQLVVEEVKRMEEEGMKVCAVSQKQQGAWVNWEDCLDRKLTWNDVWKIPDCRLSFLIRAVYDVLPCPRNLSRVDSPGVTTKPGESQKIVEDITSGFNGSKVTVALFLDLRKAFDTVNHDILLGKLKKLGFDSGAMDWFSSYLSERFQCTCLQGQYSTKTRVSCGVPQGSVLGPLLFCLYVNDLPNVIEKCSIHMYADDTVLYYSADSVKACEETVSMDMKRVVKWLNENKLLLHPDKTKAMLFGLPQKLRHAGTSVNITDGTNVYEQVDSFTYLGITLDPSLRWSAHVQRITKKLLSGLGAMRRARAFVTKEVLQTMYQTLVLSHLDYCATAWLPSLVQSNKTLTSQLDRLVNRAARLITGHKLQDHVPVNILRAEAGIDPVRKRAEVASLVSVFKAVRGCAPVYMTSLFKWEAPPTLSVRTTRSELKRLRDYDPHLLSCPPARVTSYRNSLQVLAAALEVRRRKAGSREETQKQTFIPFVKEGQRATQGVRRSCEGLMRKGEWEMAVDLDKRLVFPRNICETTLRPDIVLWSSVQKTVLVIELTIPWEENIQAAYERKKLKYQELVQQCAENGWRSLLYPVEVGCRGFVGTSLTRLCRDLSIGQKQLVKQMAEETYRERFTSANVELAELFSHRDRVMDIIIPADLDEWTGTIIISKETENIDALLNQLEEHLTDKGR
ncbi:hypothetical protein Bbelb_018390 [Branchiostoma belcheri]|nr:hypothetical protein Bbelb_018390 [Branchiostoma belcheri]